MLEAAKVTEVPDQIAASIGYREIGRSLLREGGIKAARAAGGRIARLRRAIGSLRMQALASGLAVAPLDGAFAELNEVARARPFAVTQQHARQDWYRRAHAAGDRPPGAMSRPSEPVRATVQPTARLMAHDDASSNAVNPLPRYTAIGETAVSSMARTANIGRSTFTRRLGEASFGAMLSPVRQSTDSTLHVIGSKGSRLRGNQRMHPTITRIQSRVSAMARMSLAPMDMPVGPDVSPALPRPGRSYEMTDSRPVRQPNAIVDERRLNRLISDQLERIAMRPSAGMTSYDPRVSPSYPGAPSDV